MPKVGRIIKGRESCYEKLKEILVHLIEVIIISQILATVIEQFLPYVPYLISGLTLLTLINAALNHHKKGMTIDMKKLALATLKHLKPSFRSFMPYAVLGTVIWTLQG